MSNKKMTESQRRAAEYKRRMVAEYISYRKLGIDVSKKKKCKYCVKKTINHFGICDACRTRIIGQYAVMDLSTVTMATMGIKRKRSRDE